MEYLSRMKVVKIKNSKNARYRYQDYESIEKLCSSTWEPLYRYVYYKVQNREEAEDITQETYVKALSYIQKNNITEEIHIGFLKVVALNIIRDRWRRTKRLGTEIDFELLHPKEVAVEDPADMSAERMLIENALNELNDEQRMVVELRILKCYSVAETARIIGKKENTIRVIQYRALKNLANILKNYKEGRKYV